MLSADRGGTGRALWVFLHGLGATREVWSPLMDHIGKGPAVRWLAPDLPGHGRSEPGSSYAPAAQAAQVNELIGAEPPAEEIILLGHSMGGVVALTLASGWFDLRPSRVLALGVKVSWSDAEVADLARRAAAAPKVFADQPGAVAHYLKVSGLQGLVAAESPMALAGVVETFEGWRLAMDPAANGVGRPDMTGLRLTATTVCQLACGALDPMCAIDDIRAYDPSAVALPGLGHNAMVEDPVAVWSWATKPGPPHG